MSELKYTKGKLVVEGPVLKDESGNGVIYALGEETSGEIDIANAARLALCWNSFDDLVDVVETFKHLLNQAVFKVDKCDYEDVEKLADRASKILSTARGEGKAGV